MICVRLSLYAILDVASHEYETLYPWVPSHSATPDSTNIEAHVSNDG